MLNKLRIFWSRLAELLSGRLSARLRRMELAQEDAEWRRMRLEQSHNRLDVYARSKTRALTQQGNMLQLSVMKLSTLEADRREGEAMALAITTDDDEEISVVLDVDSKT